MSKSLEDKLRGYAAKGELVHISVAFSNGEFYCNFSAASPASGYARGVDKDPVIAIEKAFAASPVKPPKMSFRPNRANEFSDADQVAENTQITAAVTDNEFSAADQPSENHSLPSDWTAP